MTETKQTGIRTIILGGSSGLGLATAKYLGLKGHNLIIVHRDSRSSMSKVQKKFDAISDAGAELLTFNLDAVRADKRAEILDEVIKRYGTHCIDNLVHSISRGNVKALEGHNAISTGDMTQTSESMAYSYLAWIQDLDRMELFKTEALVTAFTSEGSSKAVPGYAAVASAKASLEAISRSVAQEYAAKGIRSNLIQAGFTLTKSTEMLPEFEKIKSVALERNPQGRLTSPTDVAKAVYLLTLPEAKWINGAVIPVDGGESIC